MHYCLVHNLSVYWGNHCCPTRVTLPVARDMRYAPLLKMFAEFVFVQNESVILLSVIII